MPGETYFRQTDFVPGSATPNAGYLPTPGIREASLGPTPLSARLINPRQNGVISEVDAELRARVTGQTISVEPAAAEDQTKLYRHSRGRIRQTRRAGQARADRPQRQPADAISDDPGGNSRASWHFRKKTGDGWRPARCSCKGGASSPLLAHQDRRRAFGRYSTVLAFCRDA